MPSVRFRLRVAPRWRGRGHALPLGLVAMAAALTTPRQASALPLLELSGSARWLYNAQLKESDSQLSSAGFGLSAGLTLPAAIYLGASFQYFVGTDLTHTYVDPAGIVVTRDQFSNTSSQLLALFGYDVGLSALRVRPTLGLGWWRTAWETNCLGCEPSFENDGFAVAPGLELLYGFGLLSLSSEARFDVVLGAPGGTLLTTIVGLGAGISL